MFKTVKKALGYLRAYKGYVGLNVFLNILASLLEIVSLLSIIPFLNIIFLPEETSTRLVQPKAYESGNITTIVQSAKDYINFWLQEMMVNNSKLTMLSYICIFVLAVFFLKNVLIYVSRLIDANIKYSVSKGIRNQIYNKVLSLPLGYYTDQNRGDVLNRFSSDVFKLETNILFSYQLLFREPAMVLITIFFMLVISVKLTVFILLLLPIIAFVVSRISQSLKRNSLKAQEKASQLMGFLDETLFGMRIIKSYTAEPILQKRFNKETHALRRLENRIARRRQAAPPTSELMGIMIVVLVLWFGGRLIIEDQNNALSGGAFIYFIILFAKLISPVKNFSKLLAGVYESMASAERIDEILHSVNPIVGKANVVSKVSFEEELAFKNVSFSYVNDPSQQVLDDISFKVKKGETLALVGQSGAGKSTIANLLPRFYDIDRGQIEIDGIPIKDISLSDLRKLMAVVSQDSILFNDSVVNNIVFGSGELNLERAIWAANIANAHEFIENLEDGYHSIVGESGNKLSGGQKQRLTIARAVYKNAPILILDEATSALDTESEKLVQDAIKKLLKNRTAIIIAHRLSTIKEATNIMVLEDGKVIESGTHMELIKRENGKYRYLFELQSL